MRTQLSAVALGLAILLPTTARTDTIRCADSVLAIPTLFRAFRPGTPGTFRHRDLELMWDSIYVGGLSTDVRTTLDNFGRTLSELPGTNPFGITNVSDFRLVYDYFRRAGDFYNTTDPLDTTSVVLGRPDFFSDVGSYNPSDRSHSDAYIFEPSRGSSFAGGQYPSAFTSPEEDLSTGHSPVDVKPANSTHVKGPPDAVKIDLTGTGWTKPDAITNIGFNHELQHALPFESIDQGAGWRSEMFSAGAEAVGGNADETTTSEMPYTWSLLAEGANPCLPGLDCPNPRNTGSNYQGRSAFTAYLAYNFRGADTSATYAALQDDLLRRWARSDSIHQADRRTVARLRSLLRDDSCGTCATKAYFHPGGASMDDTTRLALLHHNWRAANYVNNSFLDEGQYGYPPHMGFAPSKQLRAWQSFDACGQQDDVAAIPPEVLLRNVHVTRETTFVGLRYLGTHSYPMTLQPMGSEYWVIRSDPSLWNLGQQELVVRVTPEGVGRKEALLPGQCLPSGQPLLGDSRLMASVVAYGPPNGSENGPLWQNPHWAQRAIAPRWVDTDSSAGDLEFPVPSFGDTFKAAVVVISLADGPAQRWVQTKAGAQYHELLPYRLTLALRKAPLQSQSPLAVSTSAFSAEDHPTWNPRGDTLAFQAPIAGRKQIYRKAVSGGTATQISPAPTLNQHRPDWSPRGDWIAFSEDFSSQERLYAYSFGSGTRRQLTFTTGRDLWPVFQPNGQGLAYIRHVTPDAVNPGPWEIRRIDLSGANDVALAVLSQNAFPRSPRWSPDGKWIYFASNDTLYAVGAVGADQGKMVQRNSLIPVVSTFDLPLGKSPLAVEEPTLSPFTRLCGCTPQPGIGMPVRRLALRDTVRRDSIARLYQTGAEFYNPRWSPDGNRIAYSTNKDKVTDRNLYVGLMSYNHPPARHEPWDQEITAHGSYNQTYTTTDFDYETLTYEAVYLPDSAVFDAQTALLHWPNPKKKADGDSVYYVVLRALDPSGGVANQVVRLTVVPYPVGGGGCPTVDTYTASGWQVENTILSRSMNGAFSLDAYRLMRAPDQQDGRIRVRIRENENEYTTLDEVRLLAVDHDLGLRALSWGSEIVLGTRSAPHRVTTQTGEDITSLVSGNGGYFRGSPGDTLFVEMEPPSATAGVSVQGGGGGGGSGEGDTKVQERPMPPLPGIESRHPSAGSPTVAWSDQDVITGTGILVQAPDGAGGWRTLEHWYPREYADEMFFDSLTTVARLVFVGSHRLRFFGKFLRSLEEPTTQTLSLLSAVHSCLGAVRSGLAEGGSMVPLSPGDTLTLEFQAPSTPTFGERGYFLLARGVYTSTQPFAQQLEGRVPTQFALLQNQPNPFGHATSIRFELPTRARVSLDVFDLMGRRVRALAEREYEAGHHAVEWDRRNEAGQTVRSGVYLYRITAGSFRAQRKMVLMP